MQIKGSKGLRGLDLSAGVYSVLSPRGGRMHVGRWYASEASAVKVGQRLARYGVRVAVLEESSHGGGHHVRTVWRG